MMQENMAKQEQNGIEKMVMTLSLLIGGMMIAHLCIDSHICVAILLGIMTLGLCAISFFKVSEYPVRTMINSFILAGIVIVYNLCADNVSYGMPLFFALSALTGLYGVSRNLIPMMLTTFVLIGFYMTEGIPATEYITSIVLSLVFEFVLYVWLRGREKMQRLSRQMIQALRMAERTKDEFLSNVSHELRTPLNTISGMSDLIADEEDRKKIHEHAEAIQTASRYLAQIVGNMLDFSEMQSGNIELKESNYYISDIVDEIQSIAELQKGDKDINILTDVDNTMPCLLKGDMNRIVCICMNLVGNAVKFTERGYIRIRVGGEYEGDQWTLRLAVEDSGVGMVPEQMAKMLCGNNQPDSNANRKSSGIGLGLPIVQVLLKKMKGELSIDSTPGKGSVFTVTIPQFVVDKMTLREKEAKELEEAKKNVVK
ncbi:MAG: HAMP domain-containing histidine kinase, partial [Eubacterium sp.]|nr:HAMP domain-containing histidine kinase [Eubacterium sp.]